MILAIVVSLPSVAGPAI